MKSKKTEKTQLKRPPIVTFLGHVDHGKTTILDKIRKTSVQEKEEGGITQGITVYSVPYKDMDITFIDTPGHEAFDLMRVRGGEVADIVLLIVAVDDGVKPQTKESIEIIKKNKLNSIVVLNKIDISGIKIEKVQRQLSAEGINVEAMGGDVPCVEVSGKEGTGIDDLLNMIILVSEVSGLKKKKKPKITKGSGILLESTKDESLGIVSTMVVLSGDFSKGDFVGFEGGKDKIKGFLDSENNSIDSISAGYGGRLIGLSKVLKAGDKIYSVEDNKYDCSQLFSVEDSAPSKAVPKLKLDEKDEEPPEEDILSALLGDDEKKEEIETLNVVIKACSQGSLDAVIKSVEKLNKDGNILNIVSSGVGDITGRDIEYAKDSKAIITGFSVCADRSVRDLASKEKVIIRLYKIIYELLEELEDAGVSLQLPTEEEKIVGEGTIKKVFILSNGTSVLGMKVESGEIKNGLKCRVLRGKEVIVESKITSMRCEKDKIDKATIGVECGVVISAKGEFMENDKFQCYRVVKI
jgi:translation initiation factor IF-2